MNTKLRISVIIVQLILLVSSFLLVFIWILPSYRQYLFLQRQIYTSVFEYENESDLDDSYYLLNGSFVYKGNNGSKAELLMQKNVDYSKISPYSGLPDLDLGTVAVSDNILRREELSVGDSITIYNPMHESAESYVVEYAIDENYGVLNENVDVGFGVIVFGYNVEAVDNNAFASVVFADEAFSASENQLSINELYKKEDITSNCFSQIIRGFVIEAVIQLVILVFAFVVFYVFSSRRIRKLMVIGSSRTLLNRFVFRNYLSGAGIALILATLLEILIMFILVGDCVAVLILLLCGTIELLVMNFMTLPMVKRSL